APYRNGVESKKFSCRHSGGTCGFDFSIRSSRRLCSAAVSVSLAVDIMFCASTTLQHRPLARCALDNSSARIEMLNGIGKSRDRLNHLERNSIQNCIFIFEPVGGDGVIAADNSIE